MNVAAVIVAAGRGVRAGFELPKQFMYLAGAPVLYWSLRALSEAGVARIVVAVAPEQRDLCRQAAEGFAVEIVDGGAQRTDSVRAALSRLEDAEAILIHDAARPGLTPQVVRRLLDALDAGAEAVAPALPPADALARVDEHGGIIEEAERTGLMRVQTPQAFRGDVIRAAYASAPTGAAFADDLAVVRAAGGAARLIAGDPLLMKLTYPEDFTVMEKLLGAARFTSVGAGFDAHRFGPGDHVTLCGVRIAHSKGMIGHSDADVGWHALVDAILGALGEGDIGAHFPPSDPKWKGADSQLFLAHARALAEAAGARILHVDVTLICERPKIGPHREAMRARTAEVLGLALERVSIKATTTEKLGFLGREEGLAAQATATLDRRA